LFSGRLARSGFYQFFVDDVSRFVISLEDLMRLRENRESLEIKLPHVPAPATDDLPYYRTLPSEPPGPGESQFF
jgi:hypothetical protein